MIFSQIYYLIIKMLAQRTKQKQNRIKINHTSPLKQGSMLYKAMQILKNDKQSLVKENQSRQKIHEEQKRKLKLQIDLYKRKIAELTQLNVIGNITKKQTQALKSNHDNILKIRKLELEVDHYRKLVGQKEKAIQGLRIQIKELIKKQKQLSQEKQRHLQISLTQKINLEQKVKLYQKQTSTKTNVIESLKNQLSRISKHEFQLNRKQRQIVKRGRDMSKYQQQFQAYYSQNQKRYQQRIEKMDKQNTFLKKQVKKILKQIKVNCHCDNEAQQWKQKVYLIGKQLAKTRVQLGRINARLQPKQQKEKPKIKKDKQNYSNSEEYEQLSIESLSFSEQSIQNQEGDLNYKKR